MGVPSSSPSSSSPSPATAQGTQQGGGASGEAGPAESAHSSVHVDFITALAVVPYKQQQFIVSASQDGVIKYWK